MNSYEIKVSECWCKFVVILCFGVEQNTGLLLSLCLICCQFIQLLLNWLHRCSESDVNSLWSSGYNYMLHLNKQLMRRGHFSGTLASHAYFSVYFTL